MSLKHWLLHKIFGHKIYFCRTDETTRENIYRCLWCPETFTSGMYWYLFDSKNRRVR
jgi:hypothetical protein